MSFYLPKVAECFLVQIGLELFTPSLTGWPGGRCRGQRQSAAMLRRGVLRTILRITGSQVKYFLPRTTKVRVMTQMFTVYESDCEKQQFV